MFRLGEREPKQQNGVVFYYTEYVDEQNVPFVAMQIVDDRNLSGKTLGLRRLQLKSSNEKLHKVKTAIYFLADLVKLAKNTTWFIDSSGCVFNYQKNTRAKLTTRKIKQILPADGLGCVVELDGISTRFKALRRPTEFQSYGRVLHVGMGFMFYGFCEERKPDSWRMV